MLIPFTTLLTFPKVEKDLSKEESRNPLPPPTSHLVCTTNYPAPASFLPWHYARQTLIKGGSVIWIGCTGTGEEHVRQTLRKSLLNKSTRLVYFDAYEIMYGSHGLDSVSNVDEKGTDARLALLRLRHRLEQALERIQQTQDEEDSAPVLVILEDAAALAWTIERLSTDSVDVFGEEEELENSTSSKQDPRILLLREKRRMGGKAIHKDEIGHLFGQFIADQIWKQTCVPFNAVLLTHLTTNNTSIEPPKSTIPATRGGSYGVGTGFDADDAGEENEDEELYEEQPESWVEEEDKDKEGSEKSTLSNRRNIGGGIAAANLDWRIDSLLRKLIFHADLWIEVRGLRSGKARDCHGEICVYGLARPCKARNLPLPTLPMPGDPLLELRGQDRTLNQFNQLSLASSSIPLHSRLTLHAWRMEIWCEGREKAMLFRIEPNGDAFAWSRGSHRGENDDQKTEIGVSRRRNKAKCMHQERACLNSASLLQVVCTSGRQVKCIPVLLLHDYQYHSPLKSTESEKRMRAMNTIGRRLVNATCQVELHNGNLPQMNKGLAFIRSFQSSSYVQKEVNQSSNRHSIPALGQQDEEELHKSILEGKEEMVKMGFHRPSLWTQSICWGDHDQFQHVNNVHYVRFLESNRMLFADKVADKLSVERRKDIVQGKGESFILQSLSIRYRRPVVYPDTLLIGKKPILPLGTDRFTLQSSIYSLAQKEVVAIAEEICVSYDYKALRKIPIPDDFRQALEEVGNHPEK